MKIASSDIDQLRRLIRANYPGSSIELFMDPKLGNGIMAWVEKPGRKPLLVDIGYASNGITYIN